MTLIKSISGIRGTIGGTQGNALTPLDIVRFTAAFGLWIKQVTDNNKIVIGRDARVSGEMVSNLVIGTLQSIGIDVLDLGLSTTPTVEIAVPKENSGGGIILTASHNPKQWNALKLLNAEGEFISGQDGQDVLDLADSAMKFNEVDNLGSYTLDKTYIDKHIKQVLKLPLVNKKAIQKAGLKIVVDPVNSTGALVIS